jgi:plasmid stabilization system protein ParE
MTGSVLSPQARQDLHEIWEYIARDNIDAADALRDRIYNAIRRLEEMPGMGHGREDLADETLRVWAVRSYLIIYRPTARPLQVVRILSGYRDIEALFGA